MSYLWIALAVILLAIECLTTQLISVWMGLSAAITAILVALIPTIGIPYQIAIFVLLSAILLVATRPLVKKFLRKKKGNETNLDRLIGQPAVVVEAINNLNGTGRVKIQGNYWSARSMDGSEIPADATVIFEKIEGNKAIVSVK